ncbi:MAG: TolC family protein [Fibrobacter sp.]|jgi:outer membrane protein TolC|nr:TolC family protein [Fibrobacter sp.]
MKYLSLILLLPFFVSAQPAADSTLLSLDSALILLIKNNPDIQEAKYQWLSKSAIAASAYGSFEPKLVGRAHRERADRPGALFTEAKDEYKLAVQGSLPTGTQYDVGFNQLTYKHSDYISELYFGGELKQPLLKGFMYFAPTNEIRQARAEKEVYFQNFRKKLTEIIEQLETTYWDFYYYLQILNFENESVEIAKTITQDAEKRLMQGKMSPLDLQKAKAELAVRLSRQLEALGNVRYKHSEFMLLLASPELLNDPRPLTVHPNLNEIPDIPADSLLMIDSLKKIHPEFLGQKSEIEKRRHNRDLYKSERLPTLNLIGSYGIRARDNSAHDAVLKFRSEKRRSKVLAGGIEIEIPLFTGYREKYIVKAEEMNIRAAQVRLNLTSHKLTEDSFLLRKRVMELSEQMVFEKTAVEFHKKELEEEYKKLLAGKSNLHIIFDKEDDLREAQKKEIEQIRLYHICLIQLQKVQGTLLIKNKLEILKDDTIYLREDLQWID